MKLTGAIAEMNAMIAKTPNKLLLSLVVLLAVSFCSAQEKKLSAELNAQLASQNAGQMVDVIIQFRPGTQLSHQVSKMLGLGATHKSSLDVIQGGLFHIPAGLLPILAQDPDVVYISPDRPIVHTSWWDYMLDASQASSVINAGYTGAGI